MSVPAMQKLVMIVEDDADIRELTALVVEELGYRVSCAEDGRDALNKLEATSELPSLILLDLMMPVMNGWQFMKEIEQDPNLAEVPVVVMSAVADEARGLPNITDFVKKPASFTELAEVISRGCNQGLAPSDGLIE